MGFTTVPPESAASQAIGVLGLDPISRATGPIRLVGAFVSRGLYRSFFGRGFDTEPRASWPGPLQEAAAEIHAELVQQDGARLILVTGPHMSGKKTALKYLCRSLGHNLLQLHDGSRIPLLALALDELAPGEFVEHVYNFFRNGDPSGRTLRSDEGLTVSAKIEHIQRLTRRYRLRAAVLTFVLETDEDHAPASTRPGHRSWWVRAARRQVAAELIDGPTVATQGADRPAARAARRAPRHPQDHARVAQVARRERKAIPRVTNVPLVERFDETNRLPAAAGLLRLRLAMTAPARHCEAHSAEAIQNFVQGSI